MDAAERPSFTILVVEDDQDIVDLLAEGLEPAGYRVHHAPGAAAALAALERVMPDVILLDLSLPDGDGLVLCGDLKARSTAPVVVCSASADRRDPVLSLRLGADDFVAKPFNVPELEARLTAVIRRAAEGRGTTRRAPEVRAEALPPEAPADSVTIGELAIDHARRQALLGGHVLPLTATEYRLLAQLATQVDAVVTREELAERIWGHYDAALGRSIDVHMTHLRSKLAAGRGAAPTIAAVRGFGYRLVPAPRSLRPMRGEEQAHQGRTAAAQ